jgi:hypothetical protein
MRKIIAYLPISADGFIARPTGGVEWLHRPGAAGDYGTMIIRRIWLIVLALCWPALSIGAQDSIAAHPGSRLRVTTGERTPQIETGTYHAITDTTLVLWRSGAERSFPLARIGRLEISRGRKPNVAGGVVGFLLGAAAGGVVACTANRDSYGVFCGGQNDTKLIVGAALGGAAGAAIGALLFRRERWSVVELDRLR